MALFENEIRAEDLFPDIRRDAFKAINQRRSVPTVCEFIDSHGMTWLDSRLHELLTYRWVPTTLKEAFCWYYWKAGLQCFSEAGSWLHWTSNYLKWHQLTIWRFSKISEPFGLLSLWWNPTLCRQTFQAAAPNASCCYAEFCQATSLWLDPAPRYLLEQRSIWSKAVVPNLRVVCHFYGGRGSFWQKYSIF